LNISQLRQQLKDPLHRNSLFLLANTIVITGLGFFFWMVVARYYSDYEVGVSAAIISTIHLLALLSILGLDMALIRFLPRAEDPAKLINSCFTLCGIVALAIAGIFLAGIEIWSPATVFIRWNGMFILVFVLFTLCWPLSSIVSAVFIARRRAEFVLITQAIFSLLKIPLPILLAISFHAFGIVSSWGIAALVALIMALLLFLPRVQKHYRPMPGINWGMIKTIWKYSAGNYVAHIFAAAPPLLLPIIIVNRISGEQNAYFYIAWTMASLLFAIPVAASQSLFAEGSHIEEQLAVNARRSFKFVLLILIPAAILIFLLGKWLLLLFGESYSSNALTLLWLFGASSLFIGVNNIYYSILRVRNRIRELVVLRALTAIVILAVSSVIMSAQGIVGIGYVWIGVQGIMSIYVLLTVRSRYRAIKARDRR
jgi:O-antigen/teichoic acid export membrane protein